MQDKSSIIRGMKSKKHLSQGKLKKLLHYSADTGKFTRKVRLGRMVAGTQAGTPDGGRNYMTLLGQNYAMHHLAILYVTGEWPAGPVTHLDDNGLNDTFDNLFVRIAGAELTQKLLKQHLTYNAETGIFVTNLSRNGVEKGSVSGWCLQGYLYTSINSVSYALHRLAWLYEYGVWPEGEIDHINHNSSDNRIINLRDVPKAVNGRNLPKLKTTKHKHPCLYSQPNGKFAVCIGGAGYLGVYFEEEALQIRNAAWKEYGYHPNHCV